MDKAKEVLSSRISANRKESLNSALNHAYEKYNEHSDAMRAHSKNPSARTEDALKVANQKLSDALEGIQYDLDMAKAESKR